EHGTGAKVDGKLMWARVGAEGVAQRFVAGMGHALTLPPLPRAAPRPPVEQKGCTIDVLAEAASDEAFAGGEVGHGGSVGRKWDGIGFICPIIACPSAHARRP